MSPVQIIRTVATALIAAGGALGLVPTGPCGAGWWSFPMPRGYAGFGSFNSEDLPHQTTIGLSGCETALAPVGSWAIALIAAGIALLVTLRMNARNRTTEKPQE
ncbi:hypothetical protein [Nocardiopsis listeri]|uniref:hypothetical protein n=1 Tax=Nocardiopsis listeri TaxID=53440 RepID=UPI00082B8154|nr:hypothetical protein [Nocardiopsis listeri]